MNRTGGKYLIVHTELVGIARLRINDQHAGRCIDTAVDHIVDFVFFDRTGWIGALVVNDGALAQAGVKHPIENIRVTGLRKHQHMAMRFHGRDQVFVFPGDVQDLNFLQIHIVVIVEIIQPSVIVVYGTANDKYFGKYKERGIQIVQFDSEFASSHKKEVQ